MRRILNCLPAVSALGLAACVLPLPLDRVTTGTGTFPAEEDELALPTPVPGVPGATASFAAKVVPKDALDANKKPGTRYCPYIEFAVQEQRFTPRWPRATLSYFPGAQPLPQAQRDLIGWAVGKVNATVGMRIFTLLADGASSDIPITDSTAFGNSTVLGETEAKVTSRYSATTMSIDFTETMRLRPRLSNTLFRRVVLHELGHAAGLDHNPAPNTLMNKGTNARTTPDFFAPEEEAALRLLYSLPDVPLKPPREVQGLPGEVAITFILP